MKYVTNYYVLPKKKTDTNDTSTFLGGSHYPALHSKVAASSTSLTASRHEAALEPSRVELDM